ncbi:MAG: sulfatase-like hydrolase/transferase, partial [Clostridia bacterium]|nr:sulfatase-like hydrolase/transferase [Clostridia bacterium]
MKTEAGKTGRPNILFAIADDASHFGCTGSRFVRTPNVDRVAAEGVIFENVFTPNPKCAPSRASLLTGLYPWQLGAACNHNCFMPAGLTFIPDYLEKAGYHCGFTGKGWAPGDISSGGYTRNRAGDRYNRYELEPPDGTSIRPFD